MSPLVKKHMRKALAHDRAQVEQMTRYYLGCPEKVRGRKCMSDFEHTDLISPDEPQRQQRLQLEQLDELEAKYA